MLLVTRLWFFQNDYDSIKRSQLAVSIVSVRAWCLNYIDLPHFYLFYVSLCHMLLIRIIGIFVHTYILTPTVCVTIVN